MIFDSLPRPFFVLAPMDDVTDTVFRQVVGKCAPPDLYFTEFVNVDGLQSPGREKLLPKLRFSEHERPIIAQLWGKVPANFEKTAREVAEMGFDGIDLNFGCPEKTVIKNGCCIALVDNRGLAGEIIEATRRGAGSLPLSIKTRLGLKTVDYSWHEFLLQFKLNALTIHGRTAKQMSKVPADWNAISHIAGLRTSLSPATKIIGNGDVMNRHHGEELAAKHKLDGIMIGRGLLDDPFAFVDTSPWSTWTKEQKIALYRKHVQLFAATWRHNERKIYTLNKFCKIYVSGFDGAKELREQLMRANSAEQLLQLLDTADSPVAV
ncbi:MAG: tRNA-dihydrouridine synthase [Candidatus Saccharibacteria bacterium]|nr:tRNA-dihydrouridine synthase [Candidatus Saccharibacteria bacterium]